MIDNFDILNSQITNGITLIDSSAGTGKTFTIASIVPRLLLENKIDDISRLLVVTFTNAAAGELADRIRARLSELLTAYDNPQNADDLLKSLVAINPHTGKEIIRRALTSIDESGIFTIHSFCKKMLEDSAFESGMPLEYEFIEDENSLLRRSALDYWRRRIYNDSFLSSFVTSEKITPELLKDQYRIYRTHHKCRLLPQCPELAECKNKIIEKKKNLLRSWNEDDFQDYLRSLPGLTTAKTREDECRALNDAVTLCQSISQALSDTAMNQAIQLLKLVSAESIISLLRNKKDRDAHQPHPFSIAAQEFIRTTEYLLFSLRADFFQAMDLNLNESKNADNVISFHDLLTLLHKAVNDPGKGRALQESIRARYQSALIDEFQDTDPLQLEIFTRIFGKSRPLFFIGDPKQAIYSFRGADIFAYIKASQMASHRYTLGKNWRSCQNIVAAVNNIFTLKENSFVFAEINFTPASAARTESLFSDTATKAVHWLLLDDDNSDKSYNLGNAQDLSATVCANEISNLLSGAQTISGRPVMPSDIAVLVRSNTQARQIHEALSDMKIASVIGANESIIDSEEFRHIDLALQFIARGTCTAALSTLLWNMNAEDVVTALDDELLWQRILDQSRVYREKWIKDGIAAMLHRLMLEHDVYARVLQTDDGNRRLTNYRHVIEILQEGPEAPEALLQWLDRRKYNTSQQEDELRLDTDAQAVQIVTIHKSKGLEYNIVFCPFLWKSQKANNKPPVIAHVQDCVIYDFGSEEFEQNLAQSERENLSEDLRLLYVALTRAAEQVRIVWGNIKDCENSALGWLLQGCSGLSELIEANPELMSASSALTNVFNAVSINAMTETNLMAREFKRVKKLASWHTTSFSGLTRNARHSPHTDEKVQHLSQSANLMTGFARGKSAPPANETGTCLHEILENSDLGRSIDIELITNQLLAYGLLDTTAHLEIESPEITVSKLLDNITNVTLPTTGLCLKDATGHISEMPFTLPLLSDNFPEAVAHSFSDDDPYLISLLSLPQQILDGYLTGIIDEVICHNDKWYIIDWKSNFLGVRQSDYSEQALRAAMNENHYTLQYLLYTVALCRHLKLRQPGFDYEKDFGGVYYVFLRGVDQYGGGWVYHRPKEKLIKRIDEILFSKPL